MTAKIIQLICLIGAAVVIVTNAKTEHEFYTACGALACGVVIGFCVCALADGEALKQIG